MHAGWTCADDDDFLGMPRALVFSPAVVGVVAVDGGGRGRGGRRRGRHGDASLPVLVIVGVEVWVRWSNMLKSTLALDDDLASNSNILGAEGRLALVWLLLEGPGLAFGHYLWLGLVPVRVCMCL